MSCNFRSRRKFGSFGYIKSSKTIFFIGIFVPFILVFSQLSYACEKFDKKVSIEHDEYGEATAVKTIKLKEYLCDTEDGKFSVEFFRINDHIMHQIISNEFSDSLIRDFFSNTFVFKNKTYNEYIKILDKFGTVDETEGLIETITVSSGKTSKHYLGQTDTDDEEVVKSKKSKILLPLQEEFPLESFPQPNLLKKYHDIDEIDKSYTKAFNKEYLKNPTGSEKYIYWKYLSEKDYKNKKEKVISLNNLIKNYLHGNEYLENFDDYSNQGNYENLIKYLTQKNWPKKFLILITTRYGLDKFYQELCEPSVKFYHRIPILDLSIITNKSDKELSINELIGLEIIENNLREQHKSSLFNEIHNQFIKIKKIKLKPNQKVIIPTRLVLGTSPALYKEFKNVKNGPEFTNYAFGPELILNGLVVNEKKEIFFKEKSSNYIALTTSDEAGSCPYLYSWDHKTRKWRTHGKIIHNAKSKKTEATQRLTMKGHISKFKITEEEAEVAYLDHVDIQYQLKNGTLIKGKFINQFLSEKDEKYLRLLFGQKIELSAQLPTDFNSDDVLETTIFITGYYKRYSDILAKAIHLK